MKGLRKPLDISPLPCRRFSVSTVRQPPSPDPSYVPIQLVPPFIAPSLHSLFLYRNLSSSMKWLVSLFIGVPRTDSAVLRIDSSTVLCLFPSTHVPPSPRMLVHLAFHTPLFSSTRSFPQVFISRRIFSFDCQCIL